MVTLLFFAYIVSPYVYRIGGFICLFESKFIY